MNQPQPPAPGPGQPQAGATGATRVQTLPFEAFAGTDDGKARDHNEDAVWVTPPDHPLGAARGYLMIVADGMGGHNAGEVASQAAVRGVYERYYADAEPDVHRSLDNAVRRTNAELFNQAQGNPAQRGMGTTLTAAVIRGSRVYWAHVGDSRLYLIRGGQAEQLTHDHSWVEEQVRAGVLTRLQAEGHPQRNVITRALATNADVKVDHDERELQPGDVLVLCSDGLNTEVGNAQIAIHATKGATPKEAVDRLIQLANDNGGEDNISVAVIRIAGSAAATTPALAPVAAAKRKLPVPLWAIAAVAGAVVLGVIGALVVWPLVKLQPQVQTVASAPTAAASVVQPTVTSNQAAAQSTEPSLTVTPPAANTQTPVPAATATLAPSATVAPTVGAKPTTAATRTSSANSTRTPSPLEWRAPMPTLGDPSGATEPGPYIVFKWSMAGYTLRFGEGYAVMAWKADDPGYQGTKGLDLPTLFGACDSPPHTEMKWTSNFGATAGSAGPGDYLWTVVVVDTLLADANGRCVVISDQPGPHGFYFAGSGSGTGGTETPTCVGEGCK